MRNSCWSANEVFCERRDRRGCGAVGVYDNLKVHHCKPVEEWLEKNKERIEVFY